MRQLALMEEQLQVLGELRQRALASGAAPAQATAAAIPTCQPSPEPGIPPRPDRAPDSRVGPPEELHPQILPLTEAQRGMLALTLMDPEANRAYAESITLRFQGPLEAGLLHQALQHVVDRHGALRTTFAPSAEHQIVHPARTVDLPLVDFTRFSEADRARELESWVREEEQLPMDLVEGPLMRARLLRVDPQEHFLVLTLHHLISDGHSFGLLVSELKEFYNGLRNGTTPSLPRPPGYQAHIDWVSARQAGDQAGADEAYWTGQFSSGIPGLDLPADLPRPPRFGFRGGRVTTTVDAGRARAWRKAGARQSCTLFMTLLAGFHSLLHRLTGQDRVMCGTPSAPPPVTPANDLFGYRINVLPIQTRVAPDTRFCDLLQQLKQTVVEATQHQDYFFGRLWKKLGQARDLSHPPFYSVLFNIDREWRQPEFDALQVSGSTLASRNPRRTTQADLGINILERTDGTLFVELDYNADLLLPETADRWLGHYLTLLDGALSGPEIEVRSLPLLSTTEIHQLLVGWNGTDHPHADLAPVQELFRAQARRTPDRVAATDPARSVTYRDLERRSNQLAHHLRQRGVKRDQLVGLCLRRSVDLPAALLAILKAGGAFLPIDPDYPRDRIDYMLQDARVEVLLTETALLRQLAGSAPQVVPLDGGSEAASIAACPTWGPPDATGPGDLAYVVYTSGSTGRPKGVMIPHGALSNHSRWAQRTHPVTEEDAVLVKSPFSFDASINELLVGLLWGARTVMAGPGVHRDPVQLLQLVWREQITLLDVVPSLLAVLVEEPDIARCDSLRRVICGGEALPPGLVRRFAERCPRALLQNCYGPSESTIDTTSFDYPPGSPLEEDRVVIGTPVDNTQCHIVDASGELVPVGVPGELWIGGAGLARGYWGRPDLTASAFHPDPFSEEPGARVYRTGDRCRRLPDGRIEFLGRMDSQVKLRGHRVEPGEIESVLALHPWVEQAAVAIRSNAAGAPCLAAYVVLKPGPARSSAASGSEGQGEPAAMEPLREALRERLPEAMIPSVILPMDRLPLTPSGKIDRNALPPIDAIAGRDPVHREPPATPLEEKLAALWTRLLGLETVGVEANLFDLGGDSILVSRLSLEARAAGLSVSPGLIFRHQTIRELARALESSSPTGAPAVALRKKVGEMSPEEVRRLLAEKKKQKRAA